MKIVIRKILFLIPIPVFILAVNIYSDPAKLFRLGYEKRVAEILLSNKCAVNIGAYDERLTQKYYIEGLKVDSKKDIVIFGSSRSMGIGENIFSNSEVFNHSVAGGSLEDFLAIYRMLRKKKLIPQKMIIGIDPWLFNINNGQKRWVVLNNEFMAMKTLLAKDSERYKKIQRFMNFFIWGKHKLSVVSSLFSPAYFQESIKYIGKKGKKDKRISTIIISQTPILEYNSISPDGVLTYNNDFTNQSFKQVRKRAQKYIRGSIYSLSRYFKMDSNLKSIFQKFIDLLQKDNVEVLFFLPPYHPLVYSYMEKNPKFSLVKDVENYVHDLGEDRKIQVYGSYNPKLAGCEETDFYDGMHPKEEAVARIFEKKNYNSKININKY